MNSGIGGGINGNSGTNDDSSFGNNTSFGKANIVNANLSIPAYNFGIQGSSTNLRLSGSY